MDLIVAQSDDATWRKEVIKRSVSATIVLQPGPLSSLALTPTVAKTAKSNTMFVRGIIA